MRGFILSHKKSKKAFKDRILLVDDLFPGHECMLKILKPKCIFSDTPLKAYSDTKVLIIDTIEDEKIKTIVLYAYGDVESKRLSFEIQK